jgi:hypothetical protein
VPKDPFIREKFTKERAAAKKLAAEYFERFPKERYQTAVESWRNLQSANIEFTMKRLREPIEGCGLMKTRGDETGAMHKKSPGRCRGF